MIRTVSEILAARHNIEARPGAKMECPFCGHHTFSIKRDDTLGKCFHPGCGRYITPTGSKAEGEDRLYGALERVVADFHQALLAQANQPSPNAYHYCTVTRGVHTRVLVEAPIGVVPDGYDVGTAFSAQITELEAAVQAEEQSKPARGRPRKITGQTAKDQLTRLVGERDKLVELITKLPGWLAFFHTDPFQRVVAIRFRKPYSKKIAMFKPANACGGAFGHGLFAPDGALESLASGDPLLVVEGEFNWFQLQSLGVRIAETKGLAPENGYMYACAVGSVTGVAPRILTQLDRHPVVCYDNDENGAGFALVTTIRQATTVTAFTTPQKDSDLDSFIRGFSDEHKEAWRAVRTLVASRTLFTRPYDALKAEIDGLRVIEGGKNGLKQFEVHRRASEIVIADLKDRGTFYNDGTRGFLFHGEDKHVIAIEADELALELLLARYGLAPTETIFRHVREAMRLEALEHGTKTAVYAFSHYDATAHTLYVSDLDRGIHRIRPDATDHVDVGTDGVLFLHNPHLMPFKVLGTEPSGSPLDELIFGAARFKEGVLHPSEQRVILMMWFLALFFPEIFPTRPLLALIGERGSGKSSLLRRIGQLLFGPAFDVMELSDDPKDFDAAITNSQFVAVDNADKALPWLEDKLAVAATGGRLQRRELYTTNRHVEFPITAFIAITSRTPYFRREDVADRTLILQVPRLNRFIPEAKLLAELDARRDEVMTEVVGQLQEIVCALRDQEAVTYATSFRMADFANFTLKLAHATGWGDRMEQILGRMSEEQTAFALEGEQIVELLEAWLAEGDGKNVGHAVTTAELHREFETVAQKLGTDLKLKNAQSIAQTIRFKGSALRELFEITESKGSGRSRRLSFRPRSKSVAEDAAVKQEEPAHAS